MDRKPLLLSSLFGLLAICAAASWWLAVDQPVALARAADETRATPGVADRAGAAGDDPTVAAPSVATPVSRSAAATAPDAERPFPDDAAWIPIQVVDRETREPVAGAEVGWFGENITRMMEEMDRFEQDARLLWRSVEMQVERAGWRATTDANGVARVTYKQWTTVIATSEGRFGRLQLPEHTIAPPGGYVLELEPDLALAVQVVDAHGEPTPGVLLAVGVFAASGELQQLWGWGPVARTADPDGSAVLRHLQQLTDDNGTGNAAVQYRVRTYVAGFDDPGVTFSLDALPTEPIVLHLPACGSVRARAEVGSRPVPGFAGAGLQVHTEWRGWRPDRVQVFEPVGEDGWVRFANVPLGCELDAYSHSSGQMSTRFVGPVSPGQEVTVVIGPTNDGIVLRGRLLAAERQPLRNAACQLEAAGPDFHSEAGFRTDGDGNFLVSLGDSRDDNRVETLRLSCQRSGQRPLSLDLPARTLRPGVENLGELTLSGGPLVVAGTFLDANGPHTKEVSFQVERFDPEAEPDDAWNSVDEAMQHQDGTGHFEVRGKVAPGRLRLRFGTHDKLPMDPIEFALGAEDLQVRITAGHALTATVVPPRGMPAEGLYAILRPTANADARDRAAPDDDRLRVEAWSEHGNRLYLQWPALADGSYTLSLYLWTRREPVHVVPDVQIPPPAGGDARLADIDLTGAVRTVVLNLFAADGSTLEWVDGVAFPVDQDPATTWQGSQIYDVSTKLVVPAGGPVELLLGVQDHLPRRILFTGDSLDVRLEPWPTVEVALDGIPELPPNTRVLARLVPVTPNEASYRSQWSGGTRGEYFDAPRDSVAVTDGRATLAVGQGPHRIEMHLGNENTWVPLPDVRPETVLPNSGRVRVEVPAERWQQALLELARATEAQQQSESTK